MTTRDIVLVALFAAIIVAFGFVPPITLGFVPVPITMQTLGVMLAGLILGAKRGALAPLLVIVLVAIGLPVLAGGRGGLGVFAGPTAGFLFGWVPGALLIGYLARTFTADHMKMAAFISVYFIAAIAGGIGVIYLCGILWLWLITGIPLVQAALGSLTFVPGDLIKAAVAAVIAEHVRRFYPLTVRT